MKRGVAAHREAADVRRGQPEVQKEPPEIFDGVVLRIGAGVGGNIGWGIAARVVCNHLIPAGEEPDLGIPTSMVPREFVDEHQRHTLPIRLVVQAHPVDQRRWHPAPPIGSARRLLWVLTA